MLFDSHKLPLKAYLAAIAIFCNEVKGKAMLAMSPDLGLSYKTVLVLYHKMREVMAVELKGRTIGGPGKVAEIDGGRDPRTQRPFAAGRVPHGRRGAVIHQGAGRQGHRRPCPFQDGLGRRSRGLDEAWITLLASYRSKYPDLADKLQRMQTRTLPMAGTRTCRSLLPTRRALPPAIPRPRSWMPLRRITLGLSAVRPTSRGWYCLPAIQQRARISTRKRCRVWPARFSTRGARALLVSHWQVYSNAAVRLTTRAFVELEADQRAGRAEALRRAMIELMDDRGEDDSTHPPCGRRS
jgi:hypothetical protein